jgi:Ca2+-binding EF-hand superfamily protein
MVDEIRQAFVKYDKDKDGRVNALELGKIMREMGHNPTYGELETIIKENGGKIMFIAFYLFFVFILEFQIIIIIIIKMFHCDAQAVACWT